MTLRRPRIQERALGIWGENGRMLDTLAIKAFETFLFRRQIETSLARTFTVSHDSMVVGRAGAGVS